jgi:hypothetical protein
MMMMTASGREGQAPESVPMPVQEEVRKVATASANCSVKVDAPPRIHTLSVLRTAAANAANNAANAANNAANAAE